MTTMHTAQVFAPRDGDLDPRTEALAFMDHMIAHPQVNLERELEALMSRRLDLEADSSEAPPGS